MRKKKALLLVLTLCMHTLLFAQSNIPFELLPSGHLLVKAKADGVEGNFIFDTGGGLTVFTKVFFDKLRQVKKQDGGYTGFRATGERLDIDLYNVSSFEFGGIKKPMPNAVILMQTSAASMVLFL
ncbi:aspartyl protease family protein [Chitinophaga sedimenti]|uniref:aspartyl protease family protein n=1 Tax=Chitinophaga sedimenti TaxID=2033606 RepID=UPI002003015A|nr:aspartyl protease family protein [Chitinophaga sedimenti]MCK7554149.1 aspartyl protease family protein [Chitinophaga sedimenti]